MVKFNFLKKIFVEDKNWVFVKSISDGEPFFLNNMNVWDYEWKIIKKNIEVIDPLYKQKKYFDEFEIDDGKRKVNFVAGEFSNLIWGFYLNDLSLLNKAHL